MPKTEATVRHGIPCTWCKKVVNIDLTPKQLHDINHRDITGKMIQDCVPTLSADLREMFVSGTCPTCWDKMFK